MHIGDIVKNYLADLDEKRVADVTADVEWRLGSLLNHLEDSIGQAWLFLAMQEALYYPASCSLLARQVAVAAVRNSLVEDVHCLDDGHGPLGDSVMPAFMNQVAAAVEKLLDSHIRPAVSNDLGAQIVQYRRAVVALSALQQATFPEWKSGENRIRQFHGDAPLNRQLGKVVKGQDGVDKVVKVASGIADTSSDFELLLRQIKNDHVPLTVCAFARISRNPLVVFRAIEICLSDGIPLVMPGVLFMRSRCYSGNRPCQLPHTREEIEQASYVALEEWSGHLTHYS
jgi:hypothetical protein